MRAPSADVSACRSPGSKVTSVPTSASTSSAPLVIVAAALDHDDPGALAHLVVTELLTRLEADRDRARAVVRGEDGRVDASAGCLELVDAPRLHGRNLPRRAASRHPGAAVHSRTCRPSSTNCHSGPSGRTATSCAPIAGRRRRSSSTRAAPRPRSACARLARRAVRRDPRHALPLRPLPRARRPRRGDRRARLRAGGRARGAGGPGSFAPPGLPLRACTPDVLLDGGETLELAGIDIRRHRRARSLARASRVRVDGAVLSGDVLFAGSVGRTDLPGADWETLLDSIGTLVDRLPAETVVYPGHGPATTLGAELAAQPVPRRAPRPVARAGRMSDPILDRAAARHARRRAGRDAALADRSPARSSGSAALYGYRPILTPGFEDTALFARTSGAGSDVVQKEMYTFTDRSDRSLTLRPEGTAPICRAYVEHGMHRDPQPVKLFTIAPMYRYGAPGRGRYREHWQASVEAIGTDDPAIDAELIQLYDTLLARLGVTRYHLELNSIGCRACRPAYLEALGAWLAANDATARRRDARQGRRQPAARVRQLPREAARGAGGTGRGAEDRRVALRGVRRALRRRPGSTSTRPASATASCRRSSAGSTTTRARPSSSSARWRTRTRRSRAAAATTTSSRRSAARRRPGSASARASSGC